MCIFFIFVHSFKGYLSIFASSLSPPNFTASNSVVALTAALETKLKVMFLDFFFLGGGGGGGGCPSVCVCVSVWGCFGSFRGHTDSDLFASITGAEC